VALELLRLIRSSSHNVTLFDILIGSRLPLAISACGCDTGVAIDKMT
jgi:hypothetical protein